MVILHGAADKEELEVKKGETVFIERGERFRPMFPDGDTEYVPVCLPAFRPDRCIREEESGDTAVSERLAVLHAKRAKVAVANPPEVLYHMCQSSLWEDAKRTGDAYYPPTFDEDGGFTHATGVPSRLIETANHFYTGVPGEWVCLRFRRSELRRRGITVKDEEALPVGEQAVGSTWTEWVCPHVYGGLPPAAIDKEFP